MLWQMVCNEEVLHVSNKLQYAIICKNITLTNVVI